MRALWRISRAHFRADSTRNTGPQKNRPGETGPVEAPLKARCQGLLFQPDRPADNIQAGNCVAVRDRSRLRLGQLRLQLVVEDMQVRERPTIQV